MNSEYKPKLDGGYSYYVLSLLLIVYIFNFLDRQIIAILAPEIQKDLGISLGDLGFLYGTAFAIFYAIMGVPLAKLADSWNRTKLISIGVGLWSLMTAASGLAKGFVGLAVCRIGVGVGESSASPAAYSLLADYFSDKIKTTVYSIYASGIYIGGGIGIFLGGWISDTWNSSYPISELAPFGFAGWQIAFISVGLPGLIVALLVLTIKEPIRGHTEDVEIKKVDKPFKEAGKMLAGIIPIASMINLHKENSDRKEIFFQLGFKAGIFLLILLMGFLTSDWLQWSAFGLGLYALLSWIQTVKIKDPVSYEIVFRSKTMNLIMIAFPLFSFMGYAVSAFLPTYFMETFEVSATIAGRNLGLQSAIFGLLGLLFGGVFSDYLRKFYANGRLIVGMISIVLSPLFLILALHAETLFLFYVHHIIWSFVSTFWVGLCVATATDLALPRMRGMASAYFILMASVVGLALGPYTVGKVADIFISYGNGTADALSFSMQTLSIVFLVSLTLLFFAVKYLPTEEKTKYERARKLGEVC